MIGLPCGEETMTIYCRFDKTLERDGQTNRQTDGQNCYTCISNARQCADTRRDNKTLSCCRGTARCFVSLNISLKVT